ncbi:Phospho-N-acetylmuramoyl-pentapeptide-transferase [Chromobacterium violaceum]|uniref:Phospho-N-acetylmuramoyl-pentapeptide-transferase n=1 Tax=Chromobacterium violaceum TaxID=536 RepID=A0A447TLJ3_CHRVL|nr:Phospho-N-acetylmuramoyl-pentapeptide-transferase [Chromobacterium violaceum]
MGSHIRAFNVFNYTTLRAVMAALTALTISLLLGPWVIRKLTELKVGQAVRNDGPQTHLVKAGTPTMGGSLILLAITLTTLLWADLSNKYVWLLLAVMLGTGALGFYDDWRKVVYKDPKGVSAKFKMAWQSAIAIGAGVFLIATAKLPASTELIVPFFKTVAYPLGAVGFCVLTYFVIVGTSNAVNLTDGLDGLAALPTVLVSAGLAIFAYVAGHAVFSKYLACPSSPGRTRWWCSARRCAAPAWASCVQRLPGPGIHGRRRRAGAGAALGTVAVIVRQEIVLFLMGGLFVMEALSVMIQVTSFKLTGKRVFRMAPLHHHFELKGWKETQVVVRFWIVTMMLVLIGLSTLKLR